MKKIENEERDCTFKPKINTNKSFLLDNREETFARLYKVPNLCKQDNEKYHKKKSLLKIKKEELEKKHLTFIPTINNTEESIAKTNFFERQAKVNL